MQKEAFLQQAIHGANKLVNESAVGGAFMQADFAKWLAGDLLFKGHGGKVVAKDHLIEKWKLGRIPKPIKSGLQTVANWGYNNRSAATQQKIRGVNKVWDRVSLGQFGLGLADLGFGIMNPPKSSPTATNTTRLQRRDNTMLAQSMERARQVDRTQGVQPTFQNKSGSTYTIRPLEKHEVQDVIKDLISYQTEFMLEDAKSVQLMVNRVVRQDSWVLVDEAGKRVGFINGGYRSLPYRAPSAYYIRFIIVSPEAKGKGLAVLMVNKLLSLLSSDWGFSRYRKRWNPMMGLWMQVKDANTTMQSVAKKMGFKHVDNWEVNGKICQIWQK